MILLAILFLSFIGIGLPHNLIGPAWPSMFTGLNVPVSYLGIISMLIMGSTTVASVCSAKIRQYFSTRVIVLAGILITMTAVLGFALSNLFILLCVCAVPLGLGMGMTDAVVNNFVAVNYQVKHMNWLHGFWSVGSMAGPFILSVGLTQMGTWRTAYWIIGAFLCVVTLTLIFAQPMWRKTEGKTANTEGAPRLGVLFNRKGLLLALASFFCYCSMETTVCVWGASYLVNIRNISETSAPQWISLFLLGLTAGRLLSGFLTVKLSSRQLIRIGLAVFGLGAASLLWPALPSLAGFFLMGFGCAPIFPTLLHNTPALFGKDVSQAVIGLQFASAFIGATLVPPLFGLMTESTGFAPLPVFLGALLLATVVMIELLNRKMEPPKTPR